MEIINSYDDTIAFYRSRINYAEEELMDGLRILKELNAMAVSGWNSMAGNETALRLEELQKDGNQMRNDMEDVRRSLAQLEEAIEEERQAALAAAAMLLL